MQHGIFPLGLGLSQKLSGGGNTFLVLRVGDVWPKHLPPTLLEDNFWNSSYHHGLNRASSPLGATRLIPYITYYLILIVVMSFYQLDEDTNLHHLLYQLKYAYEALEGMVLCEVSTFQNFQFSCLSVCSSFFCHTA